jgi:hypothetical protein
MMLSCRRRSRLMEVLEGSITRLRDRHLDMLEGLGPKLAYWKAGQSREGKTSFDTMERNGKAFGTGPAEAFGLGILKNDDSCNVMVD